MSLGSHIIFSLEDIRTMDLPEEINQIGSNAMAAIWQVANRVIQEEVEKAKSTFQKREAELLKKQQMASDEIEYLHKDIADLKQRLDMKTRENKSIQVDLERRTGELTASQGYNQRLEEKKQSSDHEVKRLIDELARLQENHTYQHKRLEDLARQSKLDQQGLDKYQEENNSLLRQKDRWVEQNRALNEENLRLQAELKTEYGHAVTAVSALEENRVALKKSENMMQSFKSEYQTLRDQFEAEHKARQELDKKNALLITQMESQEFAYREALRKMEQELSQYKTETITLRNRMVKLEGAAERDRKSVESLETKLAVLAGEKNK